tara:strand:- start:810 stop:1676 length:867 start_codon:yes stop_codon:yes gene_type:complete
VHNAKIQWYPGHIAKAEQQLSKNLKKVDLIIEVRDARIPLSTSHPHLNGWIKGKKHLLVINRMDMISAETKDLWQKWFQIQKSISPLWCNAKDGSGVKNIFNSAIDAGSEINQRRRSRGMLDRPVRALTLGFPNVGKSALINRLVGKRVVESARRAGVTKSLRWIRIGAGIDLLDAPGVLPSRLDDQEAALKLAICDDIGQGAYDVEAVAYAFLNIIFQLKKEAATNIKINSIEKRYGVNFNPDQNINNWLMNVAEIHTSGNKKRMSQKILDDFRKTFLGLISLEFPC